MRYIDQTLSDGEEIVAERRLHWIVYVPGVILLLMAVVGVLLATRGELSGIAQLVIGLLAFLGCTNLIAAFIRRRTTELAVTNLRVVAKRGLIRRDVIEIDLSKLEGFDLRQPVMGRLLGYGTLLFRGTGAGISPMTDVDDPVEFARAGRDMLRVYREWERQHYGTSLRG